MNITTPATVAPAGGTAAQPQVSVETKGIFVPRRDPVRQTCCQGSVRPGETVNRSVAPTGRAHVKLADPLTIPKVRENPELAFFLDWLGKTHTPSVYRFLSQHLANDTGAFARAIDKQSTPDNCEAIFEALCRQAWQ